MTLSVNFNGTAVRTHRNLVTADRAVGVALERLSSGTRLSRASDDPSAMVLADQMRYNISGLTRATANAEEGVTMLQTADGAMDEINTLLLRIRSLAVQAANDGSNDINTLNALQDELNTAIASITRTAESSRFGSLNLLNGTLGGNLLSDETKNFFSGIDFSSSLTPGGILAGSSLGVAPDPTAPSLTDMTLSRTRTAATYAPGTPDTTALGATGTFTVNGPLATQSFTVTATTTISDLVAQIEATRTITGVQAGYDATTGSLTVEATAFGNSGFTVTDTTGLFPAVTAAANQTMTLSYTDLGGTARNMVLTQDPTNAGGRGFSNLLGGPEAAPPYTAFEPEAFTVTIKDITAGVRGADITVPPAAVAYQATRQSAVAIQMGDRAESRVTVDIPDLRAGAIGRTANLVTKGLSSLQSLINANVFLTNQAADALRVIDASINEVTTIRGKIGAVQSNAIESGLASLRSGIENLSGAESQLRDTDFAKEAANLSRQQIIYQAATAMLAQANQTPQSIVELLRNR